MVVKAALPRSERGWTSDPFTCDGSGLAPAEMPSWPSVGGAPSASRRRSRLPILAMALACMPAMVAARDGVAKAEPSPLDILGFADAQRAGAVGAGCTWLLPGDRAGRLSMADDRAAVRREGVVLVLRPAPGAKPLFLTYDRWIGGGMRLRVRDSGRAVRRGPESSVTIATLDLTSGGRTRTWQGRLDCGS